MYLERMRLVITAGHDFHEFCNNKIYLIKQSIKILKVYVKDDLPSKSTVPEPSESISAIIMSNSSPVILSSSSFKISFKVWVVM